MNGLQVDLMEDHVYTNDEIKQRVVAVIRSKYSENDELKLARITIGAQMGRYTLSAAEQAEIDAFEQHVLAARAAGQQMVKDNDLLKRTLEYERAQQRLAQPPLDPQATDANGNLLYPDVEEIDPITGKPTGKMLPNPEIVRDQNERTAAQAVVNAAQQDAIDLAAQREAHRTAQQAPVV